MRVLAVNVGSSSLKLSVLDDDELVTAETLPAPTDSFDGDRLAAVVGGHRPFDAVGHRIVHGGAELTAAVLVDDDVRRRLEALVDLAPLHLPRSLAG
ncbi:MAG: acetate/propionate family kinase, partial [Acidimicrobiales bacterium]